MNNKNYPLYKRFLTISLALVMLLSAVPLSVSASSNEAISLCLGDVNKNGQIDIFDVTNIQYYLAGNEPSFTFDTIYADADGNETVNVLDATYIQRFLAKSINSFPGEELFYNKTGTVAPIEKALPYYDQTDYAHIPYGDGTVATSGDAPTAFAMVVSYLTGTEITPADIVAWCSDSYYVDGYGTAWHFFGEASSYYDITLELAANTNISLAIQALEQGKPVICAQGPGRFTTTSHFIVLYGFDDNGNILVYDPNNGDENGNNRGYTKDEISAAVGSEEYWIFTSELIKSGSLDLNKDWK